MPRTVAALYDSRAEAEIARSRLISEVRADAPRILGKDTAAAVEDLGIAPADVTAYRAGLQNGGHLLVARIPRGTSAQRVVELLKGAIGAEEPGDVSVASSEQGVQVRLPGDTSTRHPPEAETPPRVEVPPPAQLGANRDAPTPTESSVNATDAKSSPANTEEGPRRVADEDDASAPVDEEGVPVVGQDLRIGEQQIVRGGARVRSVVREEAAEKQFVLHDERINVDYRPSDRRLTAEDVEAGGLFKDRLFEVAEMREVPVVTKESVLREEVIVRKTVSERTETVRDTLRHTDVEVEDLPTDSAPAALFGGR